ncbi:hypothetical protein [Methylosinus sp. KRF6]|uniref:hypothetical protein n=1 Tax=Methylosinus sp. KRF6 TaxID=2846853 RepID=UPI001C0AB8FC|nr:hypothetical protein [Methylosinus sp. KRF6]MBU3888563.1 hypothetical protein [Methylosinus sp. KRF6]
MFEVVSRLGTVIRDSVLWLASLLKFDAAPGLATLFLLVALVAAIIFYYREVISRRNAAAWLRRLVEEAEDEIALGGSISDIDYRIQAETKGEARRHVAVAWREYRETLVPHYEDDTVVLRNSVRPSIFFNPDELHFGAGGWRTGPGLFVSVGLLLTFLGLIAALSSMDLNGGENIQKSLKELLTIASAKFIMSLTGLFCSIIFTVVLRRGMSTVDKALHELCVSIEKRLKFISLEYLAAEQLKATRDQVADFRQIGTELVAELGRPLREELPAAVSHAISEAMKPLIQQATQANADGMGEMVKDLSTRFSEDVGKALAEASASLVIAGDRIAAQSDRMDQSSGRVGAELDGAVNRLTQTLDELRNMMGASVQSTASAFTQGAEQLLAVMNQTLEGIRDNTAEGSSALSAAAGDMREAAQRFRAEIEDAAAQGRTAAQQNIVSEGDAAAKAIQIAGAGVVGAVELFTQKAAQELFAPMEQISGQIGALADSLSQGTAEMRRLSDGVRAGAQASEQAAGSFRAASQDLTAAVTPIRSANERIETAISQLQSSTSTAADTVARSSRETARSAAETLAAAQQTMGGHAKLIESSLSQLGVALDRMKGQGDRLDDMDEKLDKAFDEYTRRVATAVESLFGHVRDMQNELAPALDTLRAIVEQAEQFTPQSRRPN